MAEETHTRRNFLRRDRENRCFMTFPNTTEAIKMEACCHAAGLPGRLVPVPGELTAGCGLAWMAERSWREEMEKLAENQHRITVRPQSVVLLLGK